jgi:hypothetical protein
MFYERVFSKGSGRIVYTVLHALTALIVVWGLFGCGTHFDYYWTSQENQLRCPADLAKINMSLAIFNFLIDIIIMLFPIPLIMKFQMSTAKKFAVLVVFGLGALLVYPLYMKPTFICLMMLSAVAASVSRMIIIVEELNSKYFQITRYIQT